MLKIKKKGNNKRARSFVVWMIAAVVLLVGSYAAYFGWRSKPPKHLIPLSPPFTKGGMGGFAGGQGEVAKAEVKEVRDPVCKMMIKPPAAGHAVYKGKTYYFCSIPCKEDFKKEPEKYLKEKKEMHQ